MNACIQTKSLINKEKNVGKYIEPNVWVVYDLGDNK